LVSVYSPLLKVGQYRMAGDSIMSDDIISPRVFISYARKDGEVFATALRERLEREEPEITLWQDRARMEGGVGWRKQITDALDRVRFMVLIVTPGSLESEVVQWEWRYARQQGVCVYPVNAAPDKRLDFEMMPRWMSSAQFYDLDREWQTFVHHLKSPCHAMRVPFMSPDLPEYLVDRDAPYDRLLDCVLDAERINPITTTVALHGAGGFGKTTLAAQLCHQEDVISAYTEGILWATLGERPNILAELTKLYAALTGERPGFVNEDDAAIELATRLAEGRFLLVIDDVWDPSQLAAFRRGKDLCTRLITTRQFDVALEAAERISIDKMSTNEATALLTGHLDTPPQDRKPFKALANRLGEWPLLLELAGGALKQRLSRGDTLDGALGYLGKAFDEEGVEAFDRSDPRERRQAVAKTVAVSLDLLIGVERSQYRSLAIFPTDVSVPLSTVSTLLNLSAFKTEKVAETLANLSLLQFDLKTGTLRLHDVMRAYLESELDGASALHARLADVWTTPEDLPDTYAWRYAAYHMAQALPANDKQERHRRTKRLVELVTDPTFQEGHRHHVADPPALERDLARALDCAVQDEHEEAPILVVRSALAMSALEGPQPEQLLELAQQGKLERAEALLTLFGSEEWWRQAVLLTLGWQAAVGGHEDQASDLLARLKEKIPVRNSELAPLLQRVRSAIEPGVVPPPSHLPGSPDRSTVLEILERLGDTAVTPTEDPGPAPTPRSPDQAKQDGQLLVAFATVDQERHTPYLKQYIDSQARNPYRQYRNRCLWALIPPVVQHPEPAWILEVLRKLMTDALKRTRIDFRSALTLVVRGLRARHGDAAALQALENDSKVTVERIRALPPRPREADPWAHGLRRLAALAEVYSRVLDRPAKAKQLLEEALKLHHNYNFSGFRAPACLTLAESLRVCGWDDPETIEGVLNSALAAAHNISDPEFCAEMTARVNAMLEYWWSATPDTTDIVSIIARFTRDQQESAFSALHRVGDTYQHRVAPPDQPPLPPGMRKAQTVRDITQIYPSMRLKSEGEVLAFNPEPDRLLPIGTPVNIIDPEFTPLLAARLAAEVLVADRNSRGQRASLIQRLAPLSVENRTALDTVAARLIMAALPQDVSSLAQLFT
jgi:hypothetical protein